ncbi:MAG TPA: prolipoprotein diacylglyceryl transferase [Pyrinomonadaceae bacterium]|nr:prolipoprotein diacylglyceryl transferase [Pyrinomonadaceae bacterium]
MLPELFRIGSFPVNTYGVLLALAFLAALFVSSRLAERDGLPRERVFDMGLWMLLGGLLGSKILLMFAEPEYGASIWNLISIDFLRSGGVWYGGFLGGLAAGLLLIRRYRLPFWKATDAFAAGVALGQSIGRLGCFAAGCCWGEECHLPWAVTFPEEARQVTGVPAGVPLHPTQLYESFAMLLLFLFLVRLHRRKPFDGAVIAAYAVLYGAIRFAIEFVRADPRGDIAHLTTLTGLSTSQLISAAVFTGGAVALVLLRRRSRAGAGASRA